MHARAKAPLHKIWAERYVSMKNFIKGIKGKQILVAGLSALVIVAGVYRWTQTRDTESLVVNNAVSDPGIQVEKIVTADEKNDDYTGDYFAKARYDRDCARSEAAELLKVSVTGGEDSEEIALKNREMLEKYASDMKKETAIENMVIAKGYSDCVAFIDDSGVKVVVKSDTLQKEGVAQIKDIVVQQTGAKTTDIKISTKN